MDAVPKARRLAPRRVIKFQSHRLAEILREYGEALYVENESIVPRSGTVKTTREGELLGVKLFDSRDTDRYVIGPVTGELHGFIDTRIYRYRFIDTVRYP